MELVEVCKKTDGLFFPQQEFVLVENGEIMCKLMAMEIATVSRLDLTVITNTKYQHKGYATTGLRLLIKWGIRNGYKKATLTNLFGSQAIDKIAKNLHFTEENQGTWSKSITGPLNIQISE